jgi:hypothetical protein
MKRSRTALNAGSDLGAALSRSATLVEADRVERRLRSGFRSGTDLERYEAKQSAEGSDSIGSDDARSYQGLLDLDAENGGRELLEDDSEGWDGRSRRC